jgi:two-component system, chemotaxis family, sensor kinase CheA
MSFFDDEEILEDFLVEAGEILELLSEQLVQLEKQPDDKNLLNAIFRGFHTVKGGAGFLQLGAMVDCCHVTENLFDNLRNGRCKVTAALMDVVLRVLDTVNRMFAEVKRRQPPSPAPAELLEALQALANGTPLPATLVIETKSPEPEPEIVVEPAADEITEDEFEALLDQLQGKAADTPVNPVAIAGAGSDDISDEEFEALLDQLHGSGAHQGIAAAVVPEPAPAPRPELRLEPAPQAAPVAVPKVPESAPVATKETQETTVRVDTRRLDDIMNMVGELVLVRNRLVRIGSTAADEVLSKAVSNLDLVTADLQMAVMKTRMQPIKKVFGRFPARGA